jgi:hypothetical protein
MEKRVVRRTRASRSPLLGDLCDDALLCALCPLGVLYRFDDFALSTLQMPAPREQI